MNAVQTARGYVAVNMSFDARTDKVSMTARKDMVVEGTNGASVSIKAGEKFTIVRAGSLVPDMWYIVRSVTGEKKCTCASHKPCKHEIYVVTGKPLAEIEAEAEAHAKSRKAVRKPKAAPVVAIEEATVIPMPAQEVIVATPVAMQQYQMSQGVLEKLAAIAKPAAVVAEPRTYYWCPNRCCYKWSDTNKVCEPQPDGKIWNSDICEWITPPSGEPIDHQAELAAAGWYAAGRQVKDTAKAAMRVEIAEIRERSMMNATLTTNQGFQLMR